MITSWHRKALRTKIADQSGQAMMEFAIIVSLVIILVFAIIDFGRVLNDFQVMVELTREGSNLASRGTTLQESASSVISGASPLNLNQNGEIIITSVTKNAQGVNVITGQASQGALSATSRIGTGVGNTATVPSSVVPMLQPGQTIYITEVFYNYQAITPLANFVHLVMPSTLYEAAYF